jgi:hypothetical protein
MQKLTLKKQELKARVNVQDVWEWQVPGRQAVIAISVPAFAQHIVTQFGD